VPPGATAILLRFAREPVVSFEEGLASTAARIRDAAGADPGRTP